MFFVVVCVCLLYIGAGWISCLLLRLRDCVNSVVVRLFGGLMYLGLAVTDVDCCRLLMLLYLWIICSLWFMVLVCGSC